MASNLVYTLVRNLIAVSKTTHTRHDTEDVVVDGVNLISVRGPYAGKLSIINAREVTCPRWLVFFWFEGKRIDSYTVGKCPGSPEVRL